MVEVDRVEVVWNQIEAVLWFSIALTLLCRTILSKGRVTQLGVVATIFLIAFGFTDLIESETGAWWRPWWLLVLKVSILGALLATLRAYFLSLKRQKTKK